MDRPPRVGRPPKGKRQAVFLRVPESVKAALMEAAARRKVSLNEFVNACVRTCLDEEANHVDR